MFNLGCLLDLTHVLASRNSLKETQSFLSVPFVQILLHQMNLDFQSIWALNLYCRNKTDLLTEDPLTHHTSMSHPKSEESSVQKQFSS